MKRLLCFYLFVAVGLSIFAQDINIVYVGNSITKGALLQNREIEAPPVQASRYIEEKTGVKVTFRNCGVSGMTTLNFLPISEQQFPNVKKAADELLLLKGRLIFSISLGTNDSASTVAFGAPVVPEQYYTNMKAIIDELLRLYPDSRVVIQSPIWYSPNSYNSAIYLGAGLKRLESYFPMISKLVKFYKMVNPGHVFAGDTQAFSFFEKHYKTYFTPEEGNAGTFYLHPNKEGAVLLGKFWAEAIMKVL